MLFTRGVGEKGFIKPEGRHALELLQLFHVNTIWKKERRRREMEKISCTVAHINLWAKAAEDLEK